jgi:subtilase family serine protease
MARLFARRIPAPRVRSSRWRYRHAPRFEELENRVVPSAVSGDNLIAAPLAHIIKPLGTGGPGLPAYYPSDLRTAYGVNNILFGATHGDGTGQTIAIIDAFNDPNIKTDLANFDTSFGLAAPPSFQVVNQSGGATLPPNSPPGSWDVEESLDVEWAHSVAPAASIILVEANSPTYGNLLSHAVVWAKKQPSVSVISMSFGGGEFSTETGFDGKFKTPLGHNGDTFIASTGDGGAPGGYPSWSPNVLAVGGTTLTENSSSNWVSETGWSGSGGGQSVFEAKPTYQKNVNSSSFRQTPDISSDADPNTGVYVLDSWAGGAFQVGGTSLAAPTWAGLIAIANQGRVINGLGTLKNQEAMKILYSLPSSDFHDITSGNNGFAAGPGYDLVTGIGSPIANVLIPAMGSSHLSITNVAGVDGPVTTGGSLTLKPAMVLALAQVNVDASPAPTPVAQTVSTTAPTVQTPVAPQAAQFVSPLLKVSPLPTGALGMDGVKTDVSQQTDGTGAQPADTQPAPVNPDGPSRTASTTGQDTQGLVLSPVADVLFADEAWAAPASGQMAAPVAVTSDDGVRAADPALLAGLAVVLGAYWREQSAEPETRGRRAARL